jgi:manganese transport protein
LCEVAIAACDLAEVIGAAIALNLLFGLPLIWGVCLTALDVLIVLFLQHRGFRYVEALVIALIALIAGSFAVELWLSRPDVTALAVGFIPRTEILRNPSMLYIAIGILGATVMPHNLYLHSSIVQTRKYGDSFEAKREAIRFASIDSAVALMFALFINARRSSSWRRPRFMAAGIRTSARSATPTSCSRRCSGRRWQACCSQ